MNIRLSNSITYIYLHTLRWGQKVGSDPSINLIDQCETQINNVSIIYSVIVSHQSIERYISKLLKIYQFWCHV